jgi:hypothetical protein
MIVQLGMNMQRRFVSNSATTKSMLGSRLTDEPPPPSGTRSQIVYNIRLDKQTN